MLFLLVLMPVSVLPKTLPGGKNLTVSSNFQYPDRSFILELLKSCVYCGGFLVVACTAFAYQVDLLESRN